jgi:hypothetical protein
MTRKERSLQSSCCLALRGEGIFVEYSLTALSPRLLTNPSISIIACCSLTSTMPSFSLQAELYTGGGAEYYVSWDPQQVFYASTLNSAHFNFPIILLLLLFTE